MNIAEPGATTLGAHEVDDAHTVLGRVGVRHRDNRRVAAEGGRPRAGFDRLCLGHSGLAEVGVQVDETGCDHHGADVDHLVVSCVEPLPDLSDRTSGDPNVDSPFAEDVDHGATGE